MATSKRFALNVTMNWIAMVVGMIVPFFLTPIVIRNLGTVAYGVWILAVSTVAYLGLLDLGLRSAIIRYVSKADAQGQEIEAQNAIGAALWFRILIASAAVAISFVLAVVFPPFQGPLRTRAARTGHGTPVRVCRRDHLDLRCLRSSARGNSSV